MRCRFFGDASGSREMAQPGDLIDQGFDQFFSGEVRGWIACGLWMGGLERGGQ